MSLAQKQAAVNVVKRFDKNAWNVDCCYELTKAMNVNISDLNSLQPTIFLAIEFPEHIKRGIVDKASLTPSIVEKEVLADVEGTRKKLAAVCPCGNVNPRA